MATIANVVNTADSAASIKINSIMRSLKCLCTFFAKRGLTVVTVGFLGILFSEAGIAAFIIIWLFTVTD